MSQEHPSGTDGASTTSDDGGDATGALSGDFARYVNYLLLAALVVLALVAGAQLYAAVSRTISQWVTYEYRSIVQAGFNLAVLLIAAAGISLQIRRLTD